MAAALESLCASYWYPLYAYARRLGHPVPEAQDLTQGFFSRLLERHYLREVQPGRGRFRAFLLAAFRHYLANEWDRARAEKRGGRCQSFRWTMRSPSHGTRANWQTTPPRNAARSRTRAVRERREV